MHPNRTDLLRELKRYVPVKQRRAAEQAVQATNHADPMSRLLSAETEKQAALDLLVQERDNCARRLQEINKVLVENGRSDVVSLESSGQSRQA